MESVQVTRWQSDRMEQRARVERKLQGFVQNGVVSSSNGKNKRMRTESYVLSCEIDVVPLWRLVFVGTIPSVSLHME